VLSLLDKCIVELDKGLRSVFTTPHSERAYPAEGITDAELDDHEKRDIIAKMRVNHTGEICAQALYRGQMLMAKNSTTYDMLHHASLEEQEHLSWTARRVAELEGKLSYLNPVWYSMSFTIGAVAAAISDGASLAFVEETERQVAQHLSGHLETIPEKDGRTRVIIQQMREDEIEHGAKAQQSGATDLPAWFKQLMRLQAKVMTSVTYYI